MNRFRIYIHSWCSRRHKCNSSPIVDEIPGGNSLASSSDVLRSRLSAKQPKERFFLVHLTERPASTGSIWLHLSFSEEGKEASAVLGLGEAGLAQMGCQGGVPLGAGALVWCATQLLQSLAVWHCTGHWFLPTYFLICKMGLMSF